MNHKKVPNDVCETTVVNKEKVEWAKAKMTEEATERMVNLFKGLADKKRMKIVQALYLEGEMCVCEAADLLDATVATTSHHLRYLRKLGLAKFRKEGKLVYYSLDDEHVEQIVQLAMDHQKEL